MVQPFTTIPFPPPPQNGIPTEYGVPHTQDYTGQTSEHNMTIYGSTQAHGEQNTNTATTQNGSLTVCHFLFDCLISCICILSGLDTTSCGRNLIRVWVEHLLHFILCSRLIMEKILTSHWKTHETTLFISMKV